MGGGGARHGFDRARLREVPANAAEWWRFRRPPHPEPRNGCVHDLGPFGPDWPRTNQLSAGAGLRIRPRLRGAAPRGNRDRSRVSRGLLLARRRWNVVLE